MIFRPSLKVCLATALITAAASPLLVQIPAIHQNQAYALEENLATAAPKQETQTYTAAGDYQTQQVAVDGMGATTLKELKAIRQAQAAKKHQADAVAAREKVIKDAMQYVGVVPYVFGGESPAGWDCSGFTKYVFNETLGIQMAHSVNSQSTLGREVSHALAQPGDLVIFSSPRETNFHVGIYLGNDMMVHAPQPGENTKVGSIHFEADDTFTFINLIDPAEGWKPTSPYFQYDVLSQTGSVIKADADN